MVAPTDNEAVHETAQTTIQIPLAKLKASQFNTRRERTENGADAELEASILGHGLLENLIVRKARGSTYEVVAGSRRFAALRSLKSKRKLPESLREVPCRIIEGSPENAKEVSLAENVVRVAMSPVDQIDAWGLLAAKGATAAEIAVRFGCSERLVQARLRLARVHPTILDEFRNGRLRLDVLQAFAITEDTERQLTVFNELGGVDSYAMGSYRVQGALTEQKLRADTAIAKFVGMEAYRNEGGPVLSDLFSDEDDLSGVWLTDSSLVFKLAMARLSEVATEVKAEGWQWVTQRVEFSYNDQQNYRRTHPKAGKLTKAEIAEGAKLVKELKTLHAIDEEDMEDDAQEAHCGRIEVVDERLHELRALPKGERAVWSDGQKKKAGAMVTIDHDGVCIVRGLIEAHDVQSGDNVTNANGTLLTRGRTKQPPLKKGEVKYTVGLTDDLTHVRGTIVKRYLALNPSIAIDLFLYEVCLDLFAKPVYSNDRALGFNARRGSLRPITFKSDPDEDARWGRWSPVEAEYRERVEGGKVNFVWRDAHDDPRSPEAFEAFCAMSPADKEDLFALAIAEMYKPTLVHKGAPVQGEATIKRLGVPFHEHLNLAGDLYWSRITKAKIFEIAEEVVPVSTRPDTRTKKDEIAAHMERVFDRSQPDMPTAMERWTPFGFTAQEAPVEAEAGNGEGETTDAEAVEQGGDR